MRIREVPFKKKFTNYLLNQQVLFFSYEQICNHLADFSRAINFSLGGNKQQWIDSLVNENYIFSVSIKQGEKEKIVYSTTTPNLYQVASAFHEGDYISHASAAYMQGIIELEPDIVYVSHFGRIKREQEAKITQEEIDLAFQQKQRTSNNYWIYNERKFLYLESQPLSEPYFDRINGITVTGIEKTLLDMTVRPAYSGGVLKIHEAYLKSINRLSLVKMISILEETKYRYPYHQVVGFNLSRAGYNKNELKALKNLGIGQTFYLDYELRDAVFSKEWNIYYPKALDD